MNPGRVMRKGTPLRRVLLAVQAVAVAAGVIALTAVLGQAGLTGHAVLVLFTGLPGEALTLALWWAR